MIQFLACVYQAIILSGSGYLDFAGELATIRPDIFVVNADGNTPDKRVLYQTLGIDYMVLERQPHSQLKARSTADLHEMPSIPHRIDLVGGWLDQPIVSKHHSGSVVTLSIDPTLDFNERSGMALTLDVVRARPVGARLLAGDPTKLANILFCYDNLPGTQEISGAG